MSTNKIPLQSNVVYVNPNHTTGTRDGRGIETPITDFDDYRGLTTPEFSVPSFTANVINDHVVLKTESSGFFDDINMWEVRKEGVFVEIDAPYATFNSIYCIESSPEAGDSAFPYKFTLGHVRGNVRLTRGSSLVIKGTMGQSDAGADVGGATIPATSTITFSDQDEIYLNMASTGTEAIPYVFNIDINIFNGTIDFSGLPSSTTAKPVIVNININHWIGVATWPTSSAEHGGGNLYTSLATIGNKQIYIQGMINGQHFPLPDIDWGISHNANTPIVRRDSGVIVPNTLINPVWQIPLDFRVFSKAFDGNGTVLIACNNNATFTVRTVNIPPTFSYGDTSHLQLNFTTPVEQQFANLYTHFVLDPEIHSSLSFAYRKYYKDGYYNKAYWSPLFFIFRQQSRFV